MGLPKINRIYTIIVFFISSTLLVVLFQHYQKPPIISILILAIFAAVAESFPVTLGEDALSVSSAISLCALISYGPIAAVCTSVFSILFRVVWHPVQQKYVHLLNLNIYKTLINFSMFTLSSVASSIIYVALGGVVFWSNTASALVGPITNTLSIISRNAPLILLAIFIDMLVNTIVFAGYRHTSGHGQLFQEWIHDFFWSFTGLLVVGLLGVMLTAFYLSYGWFMVLIFFAPLFLARYTFSLYSNLRVSYMDTVKSLSDAIEAKDLYTRGHSQRVQEYSALIADELKYTPKQKEVLQYAALLHDVGKIGVTETILNKPGRLDQAEFDSIKQHPELGARIISNVKYLKECVPIIKYHHKYYDGSGYPDLSQHDKVPYESYILGVADAFDAMTSKRQYRDPFPYDRAIAEIRRCTGSQFEPSVADAFIKAMEKQQAKEQAEHAPPRTRMQLKQNRKESQEQPERVLEPVER